MRLKRHHEKAAKMNDRVYRFHITPLESATGRIEMSNVSLEITDANLDIQQELAIMHVLDTDLFAAKKLLVRQSKQPSQNAN